MMVRRITAVPILAVGGIIVVVANLAAVVAALYYEWVGVTMVLDGAVVEGILVMGFVAMLAAGLVSLLALPGAALLRLGEAIWGEDAAS